jgi:hypothetical protein
MFEVMNGTITANGIKPVIDKVFSFDEVHAACNTWLRARTSAKSSSTWLRVGRSQRLMKAIGSPLFFKRQRRCGHSADTDLSTTQGAFG